MPTEADTCRTLIAPKLQAAGWENDPHSIAEQRTFTDGRIIVHGSTARRRPAKRADYILRYTRDFPIAVVEAKSEDEPAATGLQQANPGSHLMSLNPIIALDHVIEEYRDHLPSEFRARVFQITAAPPGSGALFT